MVTLDPDSYKCPDHGHDLTGQVLELLEEEGTPVAYARKGKSRRFMVIVTCPGGTAPGDKHQLACQGSYRR